ncbi:MAG: hypothetical protein MZV63_08400 [Marinilabiliales bacterium]|nr:hypothetical protein [Marinilabiliales bacterium]
MTESPTLTGSLPKKLPGKERANLQLASIFSASARSFAVVFGLAEISFQVRSLPQHTFRCGTPPLPRS